MLNSNFAFFPKSTDNRSIIKAAKPLPVPPPNEWKMRNPCRDAQRSVSLRIRSMHTSMSSLPMV
ncbi:unnamed protein product [Haemonchus placei]|uniref:Ovule protein n=1 Tax=Haemonchus placei TaxID=6290 RepID=A0A0N4VWZ3_HAEPC|nr:unnamed protein product [Haemonchus placei]